jgi:hypothetical protein
MMSVTPHSGGRSDAMTVGTSRHIFEEWRLRLQPRPAINLTPTITMAEPTKDYLADRNEGIHSAFYFTCTFDIC